MVASLTDSKAPVVYHEAKGCTIYHGSFQLALSVLPPVDLIVADPPYGDTSLSWDRQVPDWPDWASVMVVRRDADQPHSGSMWCFGSMRMFLSTKAFTAWKLSQDVIWRKHNGSNFHNDRFRRIHEHMCHFYPRDVKWRDVYKDPQVTKDATKRTTRRKERPAHMGDIPGSTYTSQDGGPRLMTSVLDVRSCHGYAKHPTQKPVELLKPLIKYSCPAGGVVLDPFMGSGSTLVASALCGRRAIGVEVSEEYCEIAAQRLEEEL